MLYDRPYMKASSPGRSSIPWVNWILGVTIGAFVLQMLATVWAGREGFVISWFALGAPEIKSGKLWTIVTYALLHGGILHLLFNLLIIFFVGRMLEPMMEQRVILQAYITAVIVGGIIYLGIHFNSSATLIGASAGALGMLIVYCTLQPERPITLLLFFVIPVTLKPKWIAWIAIGLDALGFLFVELPSVFDKTPLNGSNIGYSAHLGGILAGWLFCKYRIQAGNGYRRSRKKVNIEPPEWMRRKPKATAQSRGFKLNMSSKKEIKLEVDRILDKINNQGFGSLTAEEKATLDKAKDML